MQSLTSAISAQAPEYLTPALSKRYEQIRSRMIGDAKLLLYVEYQSYLVVSKSKKLLRKVNDLNRFIRRFRFLLKAHGVWQDKKERYFTLINREQYYRQARYSLRMLRMITRNGGSNAAHFEYHFARLEGFMVMGTLSNRSLGTTKPEMHRFEKRTAEFMAHRQKRSQERAERMTARKQARAA